MKLLAELQKRNVFRVLTGYVVTGWIIMQIADVLVPAMGLPDWTISLLLFLAVIGLPFVIYFSWAFELTPDGLKKESDLPDDYTKPPETAKKLDIVNFSLLVLAIGYLLFNQLTSTDDEQLESNQTAKSNPDSTVPTPSFAVNSGNSIAVLPFENMSSDPEQEYFSDGITEELLNLLAKLPELKVVARTSSFQFKARNDVGIKQIAEQLEVKHVLEGSIRKSNNKVRITAQLIDAESGFHLWSETYDRELDDVFVIQDEISVAIVEALKLPLKIADEPKSITTRLLSTRDISISSEAHDYYLRGLQQLNIKSFDSLERAKHFFEQALLIKPDYFEAKLGLLLTLFNEYEFGKHTTQEQLVKIDNILSPLYVAHPENASVLQYKSRFSYHTLKFDEGRKYQLKALKIDPYNLQAFESFMADSYYGDAELASHFGRDYIQAVFEELVARDPLNWNLYFNNALIQMTLNVDIQAAERNFNRVLEMNPRAANSNFKLAELYALYDGRLVDAIKSLELTIASNPDDPDGAIYTAMHYVSLGDAAKAREYIDLPLALINGRSAEARKVLTQILLLEQRYEEALALIEDTLANDKMIFRRYAKEAIVNMGVYIKLMSETPSDVLKWFESNSPETIAQENLDEYYGDAYADTWLLNTLAYLATQSGDRNRGNKIANKLSLLTESVILTNRPKISPANYYRIAVANAANYSNVKLIDLLRSAVNAGGYQDWRYVLQWMPSLQKLKAEPDYHALIAYLEEEMMRQRQFLE